MGEFADDIIDRAIFRGCSWSMKRPKLRRKPREITCKYCGAKDLRWKNIEGGHWRVAEKNGTLHLCHEKTAIERYMDQMEIKP